MDKDGKTQFWTLNVASFLGQMSINMVNLALVYHLRYTLSWSAAMVGLAASTYTGLYLVCNLLLGRFWQRMRPVASLCLSLCGMAASAVLVTFSSAVPIIFLLLVLYGFFMSMLWPQMEAWITRDAEGAELNKLTSAFNFSWSFGTAVSPYLTGWLVASSPALGLRTAAAVFVLVAIVLSLVTALTPRMRAARAESEHIRTRQEGDGVDHSTPLRYDSWAAVFIVYTALSVVLNIFPMHCTDTGLFDETVSGALLLARGLATCLCFVWLGRTHFWQFKAWMIYLMEGLFVLTTFIFSPVTGLAGNALYLCIFGMIFAFCYSFSIFHSAAGALDRGRRMVIHECVLTTGQVIGASFGGTIYEGMGYRNVLVALAAMGLVLIALQFLVRAIASRRSV